MASVLSNVLLPWFMALGSEQSGWWVGILGTLHYLRVRLIVSVPFCFVPFIHSFTELGVYFSVVSAVGTEVAQWEDFTEEVVLFITGIGRISMILPPAPDSFSTSFLGGCP